MFEKLKNLINNYVKELKNGITIEDEVTYGDNKIEFTLSTKDFMASISILNDLTYDFFATNIESERIFLVKTLYFKDVESLFKQIKEDLESFRNLI